MTFIKIIFSSFILIITGGKAAALNTSDTTLSISQIPVSYISKINNKVEKYNSQVTSKTEKVLTKLSRWENKIHMLLQKANPQAAERLFGNNQTTFSSLLQRIKEGKAIAENYTAQYDIYMDKLSTGIKYLQEQKSQLDTKLFESVSASNKKVQALQTELGKTQYIEQFIKERKKELLTQTVQYIGNSKYLSKINKESYYYIETLKNYKEVFSDPQKTEVVVKQILDKIPAFQKFWQQNSQLSSLFGTSGNSPTLLSIPGLQTNASVQQLVQEKISSGGLNVQAILQQNIGQAQAQLTNLKNKINSRSGCNGDVEMPDFKPNSQKTKSFLKRLEYGFNVQFIKSNFLVPSSSDMALSIGYKLNDKGTLGIGISYKLGLGTIRHIQMTNQGVGLRSFIDYKIKKQFFITGGYEMNYNAAFKNIEQLKNYNAWQRSALMGISKKYKITNKVKGNMQLLYDFLAMSHIPVSKPLVFRVGYNF